MAKDKKQHISGKKPVLRVLQKLQYYFFIITFVSTAVAVYYFMDANRQPAEIVEFVPEYSYKHKAALDYEVMLKPNSLYEEPVLGPDRGYFTKIVEKINVFFSYDFSGSHPQPVKGTYGINAVLTSGELQKSSKVKDPMWEKEFELIPPTPFSQNSGSVNIQERLSIYLENYKSIADELHKELGITTRPNHLVLEGWVKTSVQSESDNINKELKPKLIIPLGQAYFSIDGERIASGADNLGTTVITPLHDVLERRKKAKEAVILLGSITAIRGVIIGVQLKPRLARKRDKNKHQVLRRCKERIVEADMRAELPPGKAVPLKSLEDLVRVADEIVKPVVHLAIPQGNMYYVLDGEVRYEYSDKVSATLNPEPQENNRG